MLTNHYNFYSIALDSFANGILRNADIRNVRMQWFPTSHICSATPTQQYTSQAENAGRMLGGMAISYVVSYTHEWPTVYMYTQIYTPVYIYVYIYIYDTRSWIPNRVFSQLGWPSEAGVGHFLNSAAILDFRLLAAIVCSLADFVFFDSWSEILALGSWARLL